MLTLSKERAQISNLSYHFKKLNKDEQSKTQSEQKEENSKEQDSMKWKIKT